MFYVLKLNSFCKLRHVCLYEELTVPPNLCFLSYPSPQQAVLQVDYIPYLDFMAGEVSIYIFITTNDELRWHPCLVHRSGSGQTFFECSWEIPCSGWRFSLVPALLISIVSPALDSGLVPVRLSSLSGSGWRSLSEPDQYQNQSPAHRSSFPPGCWLWQELWLWHCCCTEMRLRRCRGQLRCWKGSRCSWRTPVSVVSCGNIWIQLSDQIRKQLYHTDMKCIKLHTL